MLDFPDRRSQANTNTRKSTPATIAVTIAVLSWFQLFGAESIAAECASEAEQDITAGYWEIEYDLAGSELETRNTPLGVADETHVVGPGTMTIRFESNNLGMVGNILDGGEAEIVHLSLKQEFVVKTRVFGFRTDVSTRVQSMIPDNRWDGNPAGRIARGSSRGTIDGETLRIDAPGMRGYRSLGSMLCKGVGCRLGLLRRGKPSPVDNLFDAVALRALVFGPGGPAHGAGFSSHQIALPPSERAAPYLTLNGREARRTFVPPGQTASAIAARPCYSVLEYEGRSAEAFAAE